MEIPSPPGYTTGSLFHNVEYMRETDPNHLIMKKSWDLALGPLKQVPMNLFIMYMAGNSISIFPIMMVCMLIIRPVKALFTLQQSEYFENYGLFYIDNINHIGYCKLYRKENRDCTEREREGREIIYIGKVNFKSYSIYLSIIYTNIIVINYNSYVNVQFCLKLLSVKNSQLFIIVSLVP